MRRKGGGGKGCEGGGEAPVTRAMSRVGSQVVDGGEERTRRARAAMGTRGEGEGSRACEPRRKAPRVPRALVRDLKVQDRWHMQRLAGEPGWRVWYQESADK